MINQDFYNYLGPLSIRHICEDILQCSLPSMHKNVEDYLIHNIAPVHKATSHDIVLVLRSEFKDALQNTKAGAVVTTETFQAFIPTSCIPIITPYPHRDFGKIVAAFYEEKRSNDGSIHPTASIAKTAVIGNNVSIGAYTVIEDHAVIEDNVSIGHHCTIGISCFIGTDTYIEDHVFIKFSKIGSHCIIKSMVDIGDSGFGFSMETDERVIFPQVGQVIIQDHVLISTGVHIDRGQGLDDTIIESYSSIDHSTLIAHNCHIGHHVVISAFVMLGGSIHVGHYAFIGAMSAIRDHLTIGNNVTIYPTTAVGINIPDNERIAGFPAVPANEYVKAGVIKTKRLYKSFKKK